MHITPTEITENEANAAVTVYYPSTYAGAATTFTFTRDGASSATAADLSLPNAAEGCTLNANGDISVTVAQGGFAANAGSSTCSLHAVGERIFEPQESLTYALDTVGGMGALTLGNGYSAATTGTITIDNQVNTHISCCTLPVLATHAHAHAAAAAAAAGTHRRRLCTGVHM